MSISGLLIAGTLFSIFIPDWEFAHKTSEFTVHIMVGLLGLGLLFLSLDQRRLLFVSFACCAALCIFLKNASNENLLLPDINLEPKISIAHFNVSNFERGFEQLDEFIETYKPDLISLQEVTPDWGMYIKQSLNEAYPHQNIQVRIDPYGMAILSKHNLVKKDTFQYNKIPNLLTELQLGNRKILVLSSYLLPPLGEKSDIRSKEHLQLISKKIKKTRKPVISLGDFNMVYWRNEIREFRKESDLFNSRRDFTPLGFRIPHDHIFYSSKLECTNFKEHRDDASNHLGIFGTYQFKSSDTQNAVNAVIGLNEDELLPQHF